MRRFLVVLFGLLMLVGVLSPVPVEAQEPEPPDPTDLVEPMDAVDDVEQTEVDEPIDIDVTENDTDDSDDGDVTLTVTTPPANGTTAVGTDDGEPFVTFAPAAGFDGTTSFTYEACVDGSCDTATVTVYVGISACTIVGTNGADTLVGTGGDDVICGRKGNDTIQGKGGNDVIFGGRGKDTINGNNGADIIHGGIGDDTIDGDGGNDELHGGRGDDQILGSGGDDQLFGGKGNDLLKGNNGADLLIGKQGDDDLRGGNGDDTLRGWRGDDTLDGDDDDDTLYGGRGADTLSGGNGNDTLRGRQGRDILNGDAGNDALYGNRGNDTLNGGPGDDTLNGGNGNNDTLEGGEGTNICTNGETNTNCGNGGGDYDVVVTSPPTWGLEVTGETGVGYITGTTSSLSPAVHAQAVIEGVVIEGEILPDGTFSIPVAFPESRTFQVEVTTTDSSGTASTIDVSIDATVPDKFATLRSVDLVELDGTGLLDGTDPAGYRIVLDQSSADELGIIVGSVIASPVSDRLPNGTLIRVTSVTPQAPNSVVLEGIQADIDDAYTQIKVANNLDVFDGDVPQIVLDEIAEAQAQQAGLRTMSTMAGIDVAPGGLLDIPFAVQADVRLPLNPSSGSDCFDPTSGQKCVNYAAEIEGQVVAGFVLWLTASVQDFRIDGELVAFVAGGRVDATLGLDVTGQVAFFGDSVDTDKQLGSFPIGGFLIGAVPVTVGYEPLLKATMRGLAGFELTSETSLSLSGSIYYDQTIGWTSKGNFQLDASLDGAVFGELFASGRLDPVINFRIANFADTLQAIPRVELKLVDARVSSSDGTIEADFGVLCYVPVIVGKIGIGDLNYELANFNLIDEQCTSPIYSESSTYEDSDDDGVGNGDDNCPDVANPDQADSDMNGLGDACQQQLQIETTELPDGESGTDYPSVQLAGSQPGIWTIESGAPPGLTITESGLLSGAPDGGNSYNVTVQLETGTEATSRSFALFIAGPRFTSPSTLPAAPANQPYNQVIVAADHGNPGGAIVFAAPSSALPPGLVLDQSGALAGVPTTEGSYVVTVTATNSAGLTATQTINIIIGLAVEPVFTTSAVPDGLAGIYYASTVTADDWNGNNGSLSFTVLAGQLPAGLEMADSGIIQGTPTMTGASTFTVQVEDQVGLTATSEFTIEVFTPVIYRDEVLADSPVAYWRFSSGAARTDEIGLHPLTGGGTATYIDDLARAASDGAALFAYPNGGDSLHASGVLTIPDGDFTIETWNNCSYPPMGIYLGGINIQKYYDGPGGSISIETSTGSRGMSFASYQDPESCNFVFRRSGQVFSIYQQGVLANSIDIGTATFSLSSSGFDLEAGPQDELSIYDYALSDERIDAHYRAGYSMFPDGR